MKWKECRRSWIGVRMESGGLMSGNNEILKIGGSEYHNTDHQKNFIEK